MAVSRHFSRVEVLDAAKSCNVLSDNSIKVPQQYRALSLR